MQKFVLKLINKQGKEVDHYLVYATIINNRIVTGNSISWDNDIAQATRFTDLFKLKRIKDKLVAEDKDYDIDSQWDYEVITVKD